MASGSGFKTIEKSSESSRLKDLARDQNANASIPSLPAHTTPYCMYIGFTYAPQLLHESPPPARKGPVISRFSHSRQAGKAGKVERYLEEVAP
jgi:hypothetical protein